MKQQNILKILVILLVIVNAGTLGFFWFTKPPHPPLPGPPPRTLTEGLGFDQQKQTILNKMEEEHHLAKRALLDKDRELHDKLFNSLGNKNASDSLVEAIGKNLKEVESMTIEFFNSVYSMCDDDQKSQLKERIQHGAKMMRQPPPPPKHQ